MAGVAGAAPPAAGVASTWRRRWCSPPAASASSTATPPTRRGHRRRAGHGRPRRCRLVDLEFVQFHPTALRRPGRRRRCRCSPRRCAARAPCSLDGRGRRFMLDEHPRAELAPRDVVARAIWRRLAAGERVFLDARDGGGGGLPRALPAASSTLCRRAGLDPRVEPIPVAPAAHYHMGGVVVDLLGRTSLPGLWACGEVAATGVHGANRLASNSLLEALVFGAAGGRTTCAAARRRRRGAARRSARLRPPPCFDADRSRRAPWLDGELRQLMWDARRRRPRRRRPGCGRRGAGAAGSVRGSRAVDCSAARERAHGRGCATCSLVARLVDRRGARPARRAAAPTTAATTRRRPGAGGGASTLDRRARTARPSSEDAGRRGASTPRAAAAGAARR